MAISKVFAGAAVQTTIVGSMTPTSPGVGATFTLTDDTGWPSGGRFVVVASVGLSNEEKLLVTRSSKTCTVVQRGYDGTSPQTHSASATCEHRFDAATITSLVQHVDGLEANPHSGVLLDNTAHDVEARHTFGAALGTPVTPTAIVPDATGNAGTGSNPAREDHTHEITAGTPNAITPDDTSDEGVATTFARSDHTHTISCFTPVALEAASTNTEGVSGGFARSDHVHSMENLPWGVVGTPFESETDSSNYTSSTTTDMSTTFTADTTRRYKINLHAPWSLSASGRWLLTFSDGSAIHRCGDISYDSEGASDVLDASALWEPSVGGSTTIDVNVSEISGSSTFKFVAGAGFPRQLWVEDVGPR